MASHPCLFMTVFVLVIVLLIAIAYFSERWTKDSEVNQWIIQSITQLISFAFFVFILWQSGWLQDTGFARFGRSTTWGIAIVIFLYLAAAHFFFKTGPLFSRMPEPDFIFWLIFGSLIAGLFEELAFRGIFLFTFLWLWRRAKYQVVKSISATALLFGFVSILKTDGNSFYQTVWGVLTAAVAGFVYGVLLLHGKSIWIPVVLHGLHNVGMNLFMVDGNAAESLRPDLFLLLASIPVFLLGIYLLKRIPSNFRFQQI